MSILELASTKPRVPLLDLRSMHEEIRADLEELWLDSIEGSAFVGGEAVEAFEGAWADSCGRRHAIGVANGTDAIALVLRALGIGPGAEVVVPANTFIATAEGVLMSGATPRFVDVDPMSHLIDATTAERAIGRFTRAIIAVDLHGNVPNMDELADLAAAHRLALIEDAAQAHGSMWRGRPAGSFGVAGCFSFYPGKNLGAMGDGGAVVTDDDDLATEIRSIADHGRAPGRSDLHRAIGINSRLDAIQARVLSAKLPRLRSWNERRRLVASRYDAAFASRQHDIDRISIADEVVSSYHHYVIGVPQRDRVRAELALDGVDTGIHYAVPCHLQSPYLRYAMGRLPVAEQLASEILSLPMSPHLADDQVELVADAVGWAVARSSDARR
jgi:dTDP-4-amino-4,6-dideoxygalactose transaminase